MKKYQITASFFSRILASMLDVTIFIVIGLLLSAAFDFKAMMPILAALLFFNYIILPTTMWHATLGMAMTGLQLGNESEAPIGFVRSLFRTLFMTITLLFPPLFLIVLFNERRRALHDMLSGCIVIDKTRIDVQAYGMFIQLRRGVIVIMLLLLLAPPALYFSGIIKEQGDAVIAKGTEYAQSFDLDRYKKLLKNKADSLLTMLHLKEDTAPPPPPKIEKKPTVKRTNPTAELFRAARSRQSNEFSIFQLLQKGAKINAKDSKGRTPIFYAVISNNVSVAKALFYKDADTSIKDKSGKTIFNYFDPATNPEMAAALTRESKVDKVWENDEAIFYSKTCSFGKCTYTRNGKEISKEAYESRNAGW